MYTIRVTSPSGYSRYLDDLDAKKLVGTMEGAAIFDDKETTYDTLDMFSDYWKRKGYIVDVVKF